MIVISRRVFQIVVIVIIFATEAHATCAANVSASVSGTTLTINATGGGTCGASSINVFLDNTQLGNPSCAGSTCSFSQTRSTTCLRSGTHTVSAFPSCGMMVGNSCQSETTGSASATFTINSQPTVSVSYAPDASGLGNMIITYSFPNTVAASERTLTRAIDGPGFTSFDTIHPNTAEGTWVIPWGVNCYPGGTYNFDAFATSCSGEQATARQAVVVPANTPTVAISYQADALGHGTASITYNFPWTSDPNQRTLSRQFQTSPNTTNILTIHPETASGTWTFDYNVTCWPTGTYDFAVVATHCNGQTATAHKPVVVNSTPTVSYTYDDPDEQGHGNVNIAYNFPNTDAPSQRKVTRELTGPGFISYQSIFAQQQSGIASFPVTVTCATPGTLSVRAMAEGCTATASTENRPLPADHRPTVALDELSTTNGLEAVVTYAFPQTDSPSQRQLRLESVPAGTLLGTAQPTTVRGVWRVSLPNGCSLGEKVRAIAIACGNEQRSDEKPVIVTGNKPTVSVVIERDFDSGGYKAVVNYSVPPDAGSGTLKVDVLPRNEENGLLRPAQDFPAESVTGSGVKSYAIGTPAFAFVVTARLTTCRDVVEDTEARDCNFCQSEAPQGSNDPVAFADADMRYSDSDPLPSILGMTLSRTYDSHHQMAGFFGRGWMTLFDRRLTVTTRPEGDLVYFTTETNGMVVFGLEGGTFVQRWPKNTNIGAGTLVKDSVSGLYIHRAAGASIQSLFRISDGRFAGIRNVATGRTMTIDYDGSGMPLSISDSWTGVKWLLSVDVANRRVSSISIEGRPDITWTYQYIGDTLSAVLAPGPMTWRTYEYENNRMTAARDAAGRLIESHTYDARGAATSSTGPSDEIALFEYNLALPGHTGRVTRVTTRSGAVTEYVLQPAGGAWRTVQVIGGCSTCGGRDSSYVYDSDGHTIRRQNASGYVTVRTYAGGRLSTEQQYLQPAGCEPETASSRCRMDSETLAAAPLEPTAATLMMTYTYSDPHWPDKPTTIATTSILLATGTRRETITYDAITGDVIQRQMIGWTGQPAVEQTRTIASSFYSGSEGAAFTPGGSFSAAWLSLAQPAHALKSVDGPRTDIADVTSYVYYPIDGSVASTLRGRLAAMRNAAGHITRFESYDVFGNATRTVDPNGVATESTFDALGRVSTTTLKGVSGCDTTSDPLCAADLTTTRTYSAAGPIDHEQRAGGGVTAYGYDSRGRTVSLARGPSLTDLREKIESTYSATSGKKALEVFFAKEGASWVEKKRESFAYDTLDELSTMTHADNTSIGYSYRDDGRLAGVRDENHAAANTTYDYDPAGRMAKVTQKLGNGFAVTTYAYDVHGNLKSVTDPNGNVTSYVYDDFGQMLRQTSPVTGVTTYEYDLAGNLTRSGDANAAITVRTYDAMNRIVSANSTKPGADEEDVSWTYDDTTPGIHGIGRLASMLDPAGSTTYRYDRRGLLLSETRLPNLGTEICVGCIYDYVTQYTYDADGATASITYPSARTVTYTNDFAGRSIAASDGATPLVSSAAYLPFGPLKTLSFGNGTTQTWTFDARYRPLTNLLTSGANVLASYSYVHDAASNITGINDVQNAAYNRSFAYDDLNRLVSANTGGALWGTGAYVYDAMGNMRSWQRGTVTAAFSYHGTTPKLTAGQSYPVTYDAAGNELSSGFERTFSSRNFMSSRSTGVTEETDEYDGRGIRVLSRTVDGRFAAAVITTHYQYNAQLNLLSTRRSTADDGVANLGNSITRTQSAGPSPVPQDIRTDFVWFAGRPVAQFETAAESSTLRYTATDHLGTPFIQTDTAGQVVWRAEYEPYGTIVAMRAGWPDAQPLRFPGQEASFNGAESYNMNRWYHSDWGRYTSADPLGVPTTPNLYSYVSANPINHKDPSGLVTVSYTFTPRGSFIGGGGHFGLIYARATATSKCVCAGGSNYIRLHADVDLGFICGGSTSCKIEMYHAQLSTPFIVRAAQRWNKYEQEPYSDVTLCRAVAYHYAREIEKELLNESMWDVNLRKEFYRTENDYEATHHGFWCGFMSGPCAY